MADSVMRRWFVWSSGMLALAAAPDPALAGWPELLGRLPQSPNAVAIFEVEALRDWAKREDPDGKGRKTVGELSAELTRDLKRAAVAADIDLDSFEPTWEVSVCELTRVPTAERLAETEGGYVDRIAGKSLVWSPRRVYFLPVDESHLVVVEPANRQLLGKWLSKKDKDGAGLTPYLQTVAGYADAGTPFVFAMDLSGVFAPAPLAGQLSTFGSLRRTNADVAQLARLFSEIEGFVVAVNLEKGLRGKLRLDFKESAAPLEKAGKSLILEMLGRAGASLDDVKEWNSQVSGNSLTLAGPLTPDGAKQILSLFNSLNSADRASKSTAGVGGSDAPAPEPAPKASQAEASRQYFRSVKKIIEEDRKFEAGSLGERAMWNDRLSRKIDSLPMLNVDPELLDYGAEVGRLLRDAGYDIRTANLEAGVAKAGTRGTTYSTGGAVGGLAVGGYGVGWVNRPTHYNAQAEATRRQKGTTAHIQNLKTIDDRTAQIRRKMTEKYQIEF